jgi:hypothetical protein
MLDKDNKGGSSVVLKCLSTIKYSVPCPFHCKLKCRSDGRWYLASGFIDTHHCQPVDIPRKFRLVDTMLEKYYDDLH